MARQVLDQTGQEREDYRLAKINAMTAELYAQDATTPATSVQAVGSGSATAATGGRLSSPALGGRCRQRRGYDRGYTVHLQPSPRTLSRMWVRPSISRRGAQSPRLRPPRRSSSISARRC